MRAVRGRHSHQARLRRTALLLLVASGVLGLGFALSDVFNPLLLGLLLAYVLNPLVESLERRGISRAKAVPVLFAVVLAGIVGTISFATVRGAQRLLALRERLVGERVLDPDDAGQRALLVAAGYLKPAEPLEPSAADGRAPAPVRATGWEPDRVIPPQIGVTERPDGRTTYFLDADGDGLRRAGLAEQLVVYMTSQVGPLEVGRDDLAEVARAFEGHASSVTEWGLKASQGMKRSLSELGHFFSYVLLVPLYTFFLLGSFAGLRDSVRDHLPGAYRPLVVDLARKIDGQVAAFFRGKLILALLKGVVTWIGLWIAGVPFAFFIGMGAGLLSVVPLIGPLAGGAMAIVLSYAGPEGFLIQVLWILGAFALAELVEAIAQPLILGREVGLSPLPLILSFFVFGKLFGLFGLLLAVPIACVVKTLFVELVLPEIKALAAEQPPDPCSAGSPSPGLPGTDPSATSGTLAIPDFGRARSAD